MQLWIALYLEYEYEHSSEKNIMSRKEFANYMSWWTGKFTSCP